MTLNIGNDFWEDYQILLNSLVAIFGKVLGKKYGILLYGREEESG